MADDETSTEEPEKFIWENPPSLAKVEAAADVWKGLPKVAKERPAPPIPHTRHRLTFSLLGILLLVIVGSGLSIARRWISVAEAKDLLTVVLGPLFTLLGTAIAFYFKNDGNGSASSSY